jgi:hypothetical protein
MEWQQRFFLTHSTRFSASLDGDANHSMIIIELQVETLSSN